MANGDSTRLSAVAVNKSVLDNLTQEASTRAFIDERLNSALKDRLLQMFQAYELPALIELIQTMAPVNIAANKDISVRALLASQAQQPGEDQLNLTPAIASALSQLSDTVTVGALLDLAMPIANHPLFQHEARQATLVAILSTLPTLADNPPLREEFVNLYAGQAGLTSHFWNELAQRPGFDTPGVVQDIQITLQLGLLTHNNPELIAAIRTALPVESLRDLTKLTADDWKRLIEQGVAAGTITIPDTIPGASHSARIDNYVDSIIKRLTEDYPTAYIAQAVATASTVDLDLVRTVLESNPDVDPLTQSDTLDWGDMGTDDRVRARAALQVLQQEAHMFPGLDHRNMVAAAPRGAAGAATLINPARQAVARFFANAPDFDFRTTHIDSYIAQKGETAFQGVDNSQQVTTQLKSMQRVFQVAPDYQAMSALMGAGLDSAHKIINMPRQTFVRELGDSLGGEAAARQTYARAEYVAGAVAQIYTQVAQALNDVTPRAVGAAADIKQFPNLATLFGQVDLCDCPDCRSVYSPAAYLVDLLHMLQTSTANPPSPLDVLLSRRPDLEYIRLTCENTNTALPYVDLVNEILESYVVLGKLDASVAKDTGDSTAAELSAEPQYTNAAAYERLRQVVFPPTMPYNQPAQVVRGYLEQLGSSRYEVMQTFQSGGRPSDLQLACEYLRLSSEDWIVITGPMAHWRFDEGSGTTAADATGNNNVGTLSGATWIQGKVGPGALSFNGVQAFVSVASSQSLKDVTNNFTIAFWVNPAVTHEIDSEANAGTSGTAGQHYVFYPLQARTIFGSNDHAGAGVSVGTNGISVYEHSNNYMPALLVYQAPISGWTHITVVYENRQPRLYINGNGTPVRTGLTSPKPFVHALPGGIGGGAGGYFQGQIDDVQIYDGVLPDEAIAALASGNQSLSSFYYDPNHRPADLVAALRNVREFLKQTGISYPDLIELLKTHFVNPAQALALDAPPNADPCDLDQTTIKNLDLAALGKMHRFIRLWRKAGGGMAELDKALTALQAADLTADFLQKLARVKQLQGDLQLSPVQIYSLWANIDTQGDDALYKKVFLNRAVFNPNDPNDSGRDFRPKPDGSVLTDTSKTITGNALPLTAALRVSVADLALIRTDARLAAANAPLTLANVSVLYRYAILARALKLSIKDLIDLKTFAGANLGPFSTPDHTVRFVKLVQKVQASGFSVMQLNYLYRHLFDPAGSVAPQRESLHQIIRSLHDGLTHIAADYMVADDPTGDLTRSRLSEILDSAVVDQAMQMINGSTVYTALFTSRTPVRFPADLASRITYDGNAKLLRLIGPLSNGDRDNLLAKVLPARLRTDATYKAAINELYQQPRTFITDKLSGFLDMADAVAKLLDNQPATTGGQPLSTEGKFYYVLDRLSTYLRTLRGTNLVKQALGSALKLDAPLVDLLLQRLNGGQIGTAGLALSEAGISATYFSDPQLTTATVSRIDPKIAFGESTPAAEAIPPGTGSARWSGLLVVPNNGAYRFYVRTAGAARLWLGDGTQLIIDVGAGQTANESSSNAIDLKAGHLYDLRLEIRQMSNPAIVELRWSGDGTPKDFIPPADLYPASIVDAFVKAFTLLHKVGLIVNGCKLTAREVAYLLDHAADFAGFDLQSLPLDRNAPGPVDQQAVAFFTQWQRLSDYTTLRDSLPLGASMLIDVFGAAVFAAGLSGNDPRAASAALDLRQKLLAATGWDGAVLDALRVAAVFNLAAGAFKNEVWLLRLQAAVRLARRLGVLPTQLFQWATVAPSTAQAQDIKRTVKALYDEETWLTVAGALNNRLRENQRDALTSYLLPRLGLSDSNRLFEFFLIDVDMSACMATSRIKQAIASVQLFVQRCLMNLEPAVGPTTIDPHLWQWMKHYRVWEANRKVFLYPENWIEPELRDDQSPFFKELRTELLQSDMTPEVAETAFLHYLSKLDQVDRLEICGLYWQLETDETGQTIDVLHVFGRTFAVPYIYYYRRLKNRSVWTAWEKVDLDIAGDHLIPVVFNRRLYLFWPIFIQKVPADQKIPEPNVKGTPPQKYWEISLAWSEYKQSKWLPKQVSNGPDGILSTDLSLHWIVYTPDDSDRRQYVFETIIEDDEQAAGHQASPSRRLVIWCQRGDKEKISTNATTRQASERVTDVGRFVVRSSGSITASNAPRVTEQAPQVVAVLPNSQIKAQTFAGRSPLRLISTTENASVRTFTSLPSPYQVLHQWQFAKNFALQKPDPYKYQPFFYQDERHTYFVMPEEAREAVGIRIEARFFVHYHPYVWTFIQALNTRGLPGLLTINNQRPTDKGYVFRDQYKPTYRVPLSYPEEDVDFDYGGAYALYNWELFFHAPLLIAARLSKNQQFEAAQQWFHYIFDPTSPDPTTPTDRSPEEWARERYWKVLPFQLYEWDRIADLLDALSYTGTDPSRLAYKQEVVAQVNDWLHNPFNPHAIARLRQVAYQKNVVMKYIDNLIAWGDQLFRQNTLETINEATQLYVLAADLLGPRPERISPRGTLQPETYHSLKGKLDIFSNTLVALENQFPFSTTAPIGGPNGSGPMTMLTVGRTLYFGIPQNDRLLGYWDTVADRLFKIRHCLNIEGMAQQLPLFEPPIEPGLLVQAAAMGVDLGSALNDVNAATPYYRFGYMLQKAQELCADLKSLGAALLSALEKRDGEALSLLRSTHEIQMLNAARQVRVQQVEEARQTLEGLRKSRLVTETRYIFYSTIPQRIEYENEQVEQLGVAQDFQIAAQVTDIAASVAYLIPDFVLGISGAFSSPVTTLELGGKNIGSALQATSRVLSFIASLHSHEANMASIQGAWARRSDDWRLQAELAQKELEQIDKQILAAQIRLAIAEQEVKNHDLQIENTRAVDDYLRHKYTNQELYDWMVSQTSALYFQTYQMAYDLARRAEKAYRFERGVTTSSFIQFGYWDSLKQGLLAGEQLSLGLKQMEKAFLEQNKREYEITKQVSLRLHDPLALIALKETGCCYVTLPEALFDVDYPGHYMRRIRSVSLTVPCVVGPYTSINCTLTLLGNKIRVNSNAQMDYHEQEDDPRFINNFAAVQSIATSHGQNDSGLFELNFRDERYLPFEGAGAVSEWRLDLPRECNAFDFETISDVIIKLSYTAREGGELLRKKAWNAATLPGPHAQKAREPLGAAPAQEGLTRLYSARHEFSGEWHRFLTPADTASGQTLSLDLSKERFPFQYRGRDIHISQVELFLTFKSDDNTKLYRDGEALKVSLTPPGGTAASGSLTSLPAFLNGVPHGLIEFDGAGLGTWTLAVAEEDIVKIVAALHYSVTVNGTEHHRLKADAIQDLVIVCHYSIT